jgi:hypothetical protein
MAFAGAVTVLLGSSVFAQSRNYPGTYGRVANGGYASRVVEGTVASVVPARNGERVRLTNGMDLLVPNSITGANQGRRYGASTLQPGDVVRMTVYGRQGDGRDAEVRSLELVQSNSRNGNDRQSNSRYGNDRRLNGTVVSVDRRNRSLVMQTDNGQTVSVDLNTYSRGNAAASFRRGDRISVSGRMNRGTVLADDIRVGSTGQNGQNDQRGQHGHR